MYQEIKKEVNEVMNERVVSLEHFATAFDAAELMRDQKCGFVPVTNSGKLVGVVTDRDLVMRVICPRERATDLRLSSIMNTDICFAHPEESIENVAWMMSLKKIRRIPIVDSKRMLLGVVSLSDLAVESDGAIHDIVVEVQEELMKTYCRQATSS